MRSEPSGSLNATRRSAPFRATSAERVGMPTVFCPPSVSALKTSVARYFSGSRAAITDSASGVRFALAFVMSVFAFDVTLLFALLSERWQALPTKHKTHTKNHAVNFPEKTGLTTGSARLGFKAVVFITFSESQGSNNYKGGDWREVVGYHARAVRPIGRLNL